MSRDRVVFAALVFPAILATVAWFLIIPHNGLSGTTARAEFEDVGLLNPGDDVRVFGATGGSVRRVRLTDRGTAMVTISLNKGVRVLRADATASVRDTDLLGGTYLALDPGAAHAPLTRPIGVRRTYVATRVQDLFNSFDQPTRAALQAILGELAVALDRRGAEVNRAVLHLQPAIAAVRAVSAQLSSQRAELGRTINALRALTAQLAPRSVRVQQLIDGLNGTFTSTASHARGLDAGLRLLPSTLERLTPSLLRLASTADAARPIARDVAAVSPQLTRVARKLAPFVAEARPALLSAGRLAHQTRQTLTAGKRTLPRLSRALRSASAAAPGLRAFVAMFDPLVDYFVVGIAKGLGGLASEPGTQAVSDQPGRNYFRGEAVLGCEMFGTPTRPGCLSDLVGALASAHTRRDHGQRTPGLRRPAASAPPRRTRRPLTQAPSLPADALENPAVPTQQVNGLLDFLLGS